MDSVLIQKSFSMAPVSETVCLCIVKNFTDLFAHFYPVSIFFILIPSMVIRKTEPTLYIVNELSKSPEQEVTFLRNGNAVDLHRPSICAVLVLDKSCGEIYLMIVVSLEIV